MSQHRFQVNLGGMIEVLSDHLYSSPDVYIRELLQNAVDAIVAREKYTGAQEQASRAQDTAGQDPQDGQSDTGQETPAGYAGQIHVTLESGCLHFMDNGIGLSEDEIHRFLAIIGESSKKELENGQLRSDYIGRFGIGLLSCFMVSDEIKVITHSVHEEKTYVWNGKPDGTYILEESTADHATGTEIILYAKPGSEHYFGYDKVMDLLMHYGLILPYPVYLADGEKKVRINPVELPWEKRDVPKEELMQFGRVMFKSDFLDCVLLHSDTGEASGVAYFLPHSVPASVKQAHMIYLKNMLLTEKGEDILPDWAFFTQCIINAKTLRPTASREGFYVDDVLERTRKELGDCISSYLIRLAKEDKGMFRRFMSVHNLALRSMAVSDDEMFDIFIDELDFATTRGYMTGLELRMSNEPLLFADWNEYRQLSQIFVSQNKLLLDTSYVYTAELLGKLAEKYGLTLLKVNADEVEEMLKDVSVAEAERCVDLLLTAEKVLEPFSCKAEIKQFIPSNLPAFYYLDEKASLYQQVQRAMEHADDLFGGMLENFADSMQKTYPTIYLNYRNPLIKKLADSGDQKLAADVIMVIYVQTLLVGGFQLRNNELGYMNEKLLSLLDMCI